MENLTHVIYKRARKRILIGTAPTPPSPRHCSYASRRCCNVEAAGGLELRAAAFLADAVACFEGLSLQKTGFGIWGPRSASRRLGFRERCAHRAADCWSTSGFAIFRGKFGKCGNSDFGVSATVREEPAGHGPFRNGDSSQSQVLREGSRRRATEPRTAGPQSRLPSKNFLAPPCLAPEPRKSRLASWSASAQVAS